MFRTRLNNIEHIATTAGFRHYSHSVTGVGYDSGSQCSVSTMVLVLGELVMGTDVGVANKRKYNFVLKNDFFLQFSYHFVRNKSRNNDHNMFNN